MEVAFAFRFLATLFLQTKQVDLGIRAKAGCGVSSTTRKWVRPFKFTGCAKSKIGVDDAALRAALAKE